MSVGGKVLQVRELADRVDIDVYDPAYGDEMTVGVVVCEDSRAVKIGDTVWWQSGHAMWTPEPDRVFVDRKIPRIGNSRGIHQLNTRET